MRQCRCYYDGWGDGRIGDDADQVHQEDRHFELAGGRGWATRFEGALLQIVVVVATKQKNKSIKKKKNIPKIHICNEQAKSIIRLRNLSII